MKAAKVRKSRTANPKPAAETIPLAGVSITIPKPSMFTNAQNDEKTVTFDGDRLASALRYIALVCPNLDRFTDPGIVGLEVAAIAEECLAMSDTDLAASNIDCNAVFWSISNRLSDLAHQINAKDRDGWNKLESVTITRKPAPEVA
jgi:hypothetical protein